MRVDNNVKTTNDLNIKSNSNLNNTKDIGSKGIKKDMGFEIEMQGGEDCKRLRK